ncbi:MAG: hypothetical protein RL149_951 [Actinomycetota bacterium]
MRRLRAKLAGDRGNAIVEFVFVFCVLGITILLFIVQSLMQIRHHLGALAMAKEALRTLQLTSSESEAMVAADEVAAVFGLGKTEIEVQVGQCVGGQTQVTARVSGAAEVARGVC